VVRVAEALPLWMAFVAGIDRTKREGARLRG